ncbi:hypothetical protein [Streptomyces lavendulae]|uniref:hypothetical protein n=1 Tax=Streptomyces lavendulae TaxID=1914 RepID=UPI0036879D18
MPEESETTSETRERRTQRATILAALGGAFIGALFGLAGSILVYQGAENTRRDAVEARQAEDAERRADIRRKAYAGLAGSSTKYVDQASTLLLFSINTDNNAVDRTRQMREQYIPASIDLTVSYAAVRLVATDEGRRRLAALGDASSLVGKIATDWAVKGPPEDLTPERYREITDSFASAAQKHMTALTALIDSAAGEVL